MSRYRLKDAPSPETRTFLIAEEVADERRTTVESLSRERTAGEGPPFYKIGSRILYDRDDLDAWYAKHRAGAENAPEPSRVFQAAA